MGAKEEKEKKRLGASPRKVAFLILSSIRKEIARSRYRRTSIWHWNEVNNLTQLDLHCFDSQSNRPPFWILTKDSQFLMRVKGKVIGVKQPADNHAKKINGVGGKITTADKIGRAQICGNGSKNRMQINKCLVTHKDNWITRKMSNKGHLESTLGCRWQSTKGFLPEDR